MMANRIIRFFQQPAGVFHASVFHQFSGGVGPSCLVLDNSVNENLYVGHYEVKGKYYITMIGGLLLLNM